MIADCIRSLEHEQVNVFFNLRDKSGEPRRLQEAHSGRMVSNLHAIIPMVSQAWPANTVLACRACWEMLCSELLFARAHHLFSSLIIVS